MDEEAKKLLRDLVESLRRSGSDGLIGNINRLSDSANSAADNLDSVERSSKGIKKNQDELAKDFKTFGKRDLGDLKYKLENSAREVKEFARSVRDAEERVQNSTNATERANAQASLASKKSHLDEIATRQRILERNVNAHIDYVDSIEDAAQSTKSAFKNLVDGVGTLLTSLQSGGSAIGVAGGILSTGITVAGNLGSAAGAGLSAAGSAASAFGKKGKVVGAALDLLGIGIAGASKGISALASAVLPYMIKEVERTLDSFQRMSTAGAVFSDGMTGMRHAASDAGLSLETFSKITTANAESFGATGLGVTGAAKKFADVSNIMSRSGIQQQILNLGYSLEEYGSLTADVMANLNRTGNLRSVSDEQIANITSQYAKDLRIISSITGEDAKKKLAAVRAENDILAFQQKLAEKSPEQQQAIEAAMASMTAAQQKNLREMIVFGSVINQEGAIMEATIPAQAELTRSFKELYDSNQLNAENVSRLQSQKSPEILRQGQSQGALGQAGYFGGIAGGSAQAINELIKNSRKYTDTAVEGGITGVNKQATTQDELTKSTIDVVLAVEAMRVEMEKLVMDSGALAKFSEMLSEITKVMAEGLKELGGAATGNTAKGAAIGSGIGDVVGAGVGTAAGAAVGGKLAGRALAARATGGLAGRALGGLGGSLLGPGGAVLGMVAGGALGDYLGGKIGEAISGLLGEGKSLGGISAGPDSGYLEKLHGVEAVVPLPDGRSIPVTMDSSGDSAMLNLMKEQVELFKDMLDTLRNSEDLQDRMLANSF
jgi:uncharacterized protein YoxC